MADDKRLIGGGKREADDGEPSLRPQRLGEFIGQEQARANLKVFIEAAKARGMTRAELIGQIDHARPPEVGLATALRLFVVAELRR